MLTAVKLINKNSLGFNELKKTKKFAIQRNKKWFDSRPKLATIFASSTFSLHRVQQHIIERDSTTKLILIGFVRLQVSILLHAGQIICDGRRIANK
jgi:hypothetical protein